MNPYLVRPGRGEDDHRLYVISPEGRPIGHLDRSNGHIEVYKPEDDRAFRTVLAAFLRSSPRDPMANREDFTRISSRPLADAGTQQRRRRAHPEPTRRSSDRKWLTALALSLLVLLVAPRLSAQPEDKVPPRPSPSPFVEPAPVRRGPTSREALSRKPLGTPQLETTVDGPYKFLSLQPSSNAPVAYDPCRAVSYVVNTRTAPPGGKRLVTKAVRLISQATGLKFVYEGETHELPARRRRSFQPRRYGDPWAPVLIAWSDAGELPRLRGSTAGAGGSRTITTPEGVSVYVTGVVAVDGPQMAGHLGRAEGEAEVIAVLLHELAHVVGLDHVDEPSQLMFERSLAGGLQGGDVAGLRKLGEGECVPLL